MILALHIQLVHSFVEQMPSNTPFSPCTIREMNKLDLHLSNEKPFKKFRNTFKFGLLLLS